MSLIHYGTRANLPEVGLEGNVREDKCEGTLVGCLAASPDTSVPVPWASPELGALSALSQRDVRYKAAIIASGMSTGAGGGRT